MIKGCKYARRIVLKSEGHFNNFMYICLISYDYNYNQNFW